MDATLPAVAKELLEEIGRAFRESARVPDDLLSAARWLEKQATAFHLGTFGATLSVPSLLASNVQAICRRFQKRLRLKFVFGPSAVPALDLVDRHSVTRAVSPSGRMVYQVIGSSGKTYTCYAACHFCTCPAFMFSVLRKGDSLVCKHLLAVYLSRALGSCQEVAVPDPQLARLLLPEETRG